MGSGRESEQTFETDGLDSIPGDLGGLHPADTASDLDSVLDVLVSRVFRVPLVRLPAGENKNEKSRSQSAERVFIVKKEPDD